MKIYIAGPMRGKPAWNFPLFDQAATDLEAAGHHPLNPAATCRALGYDTMDDGSVTRKHLLHVIRVDIASIDAADAVLLLPDWEQSLGATVEVAYANWLGLALLEWPSHKPVQVNVCPWHTILKLKEQPDALDVSKCE